jgi:hopanoid biosynthesis associated RND transporter like protein HpnN
LLIASLAFLPYVYFDYDPLNLRDPESESVATLRDLIASGIVNPWAVSFTTDSQESVQTLSAEIRELDSVDRVVSALELIPDDQREKLVIVDEMRFLFGEPLFETVLRPVASPKQVLATISEFRAALGKGGVTELSLQRSLAETVGDLLVRVQEASPEDQRQKLSELQDTLLGYFPLFMQSLRDSLNADVVTMDSLPDSLRARWVTVDGAYRVEVSPDASLEDNGELREFADDVRAVKGDVTGDLISTIESGDLVVRAFQQGFVSAFVLVAVLLVVFLQSIRSTLLVLLPLMLAGSLTVASTVVLDLPFNFANILALPLLLGLGVDNGIHIVQRARGHHYSESALLKTSTARAIFFSALTTIFSFGNLAFSPHPGTASMGILLTLGVLFTLFATLVILPAFLHNPRGRA